MESVVAFDIKSVSPTFQTYTSFGAVVSTIIKNAFVLAGVISFVLLIFGAFSFIVGAGGDSKQMEGAKNTITAAIAGLLVVVGSLFIVKVISVVTGVDILSPKF
ncbi:hypothetical protein HY086_00625 [Candidatus Gottesmanbacteria bacterium]|nr:hypothetical protein [Candidatus Gottesmanbacteria bacterium]